MSVAVCFDSSTLARRYILTEPGSERVRVLCRPDAAGTLVISRLAPLEMASAFNRRLREGSLTTLERDQLWKLFTSHLHGQYQLVGLTHTILERAERLLFTHPLRAFDALHIATALEVATSLRATDVELRFCTSDRRQAEAARAEGLTIDLIAE